MASITVISNVLMSNHTDIIHFHFKCNHVYEKACMKLKLRCTYCLTTAAVMITCVFYIVEYDDTFNVQPQPIQFLEEPTDHVTLAGADVTFVCSTTVLMSNDISSPHITWLYNNSIIESGHH